MTFSVNQDMDGAAAIANSSAHPGIRMLTVNTDTSTAPRNDIAGAKGADAVSTWLVSQPSSFGTDLFGHPSAICYYTARALDTHFGGQVCVWLHVCWLRML